MPTRALRSAASGMYAQQVNIEVISNNIANVNTTGFKKNKAEFQDLMYQEVQINPQSASHPGINEATDEIIRVGNGVKTASTQKVLKQGDITATQNMLDLAIQGEGFFQVRRSDGTFAYTRDGSFKMNSEGAMVTSGGFVLDPEIRIDENVTGITISRDGQIEANEFGGGTVNLGKIDLIRFINPGGLKPLGDNLYAETEASGPAINGDPGTSGFGEIHQGYLESSNVDIVEEMISMITAQRAYEMNSKTVKTVEDMLATANELKRG
jgi:flagellar basal-body rod protein FlgG